MASAPYGAWSLLQAGSWQGAGHEEDGTLLTTLGMVAAAIAAAGFLYLVGKAVKNQRRYRAVDVLKDPEVKKVHEAIVAAEKRTVGEIVPVVLEQSDRHPQGEWLAALTALLVGTATLSAFLPWDRPALLVLCQLGLGLMGFLCARWLPDFKRFFVSERRATEMAEEQAMQEFFGLGLHQTEARTGVLLFVSLFERRVVVIGDSGIDEKIDKEHWVETDQAILDGVKEGRLGDGLVAGIRRCASVLEEHFPWKEGDRNEIPDRLVVRAE